MGVTGRLGIVIPVGGAAVGRHGALQGRQSRERWSGASESHIQPRRAGLHGRRAGSGHLAQNRRRRSAQAGYRRRVPGPGRVAGGGAGYGRRVSDAGGADCDRRGGPHRGLGGGRRPDGGGTDAVGQAVFNGFGAGLGIATAAWRAWRRDYHLARPEAPCRRGSRWRSYPRRQRTVGTFAC